MSSVASSVKKTRANWCAPSTGHPETRAGPSPRKAFVRLSSPCTLAPRSEANEYFRCSVSAVAAAGCVPTGRVESGSCSSTS